MVAYEWVEVLYKDTLPLADFLKLLGMFAFTALNEKNAPEFFMKMNCYVKQDKLVKFYSFVWSLLSKKA